MAWTIRCVDTNCTKVSSASDIVELIKHHTDESNMFIGPCGKHGYIEKKFRLQEVGQLWEPCLRGVIELGDPSDTYQPFAFLVSKQPRSKVNDLWLSYYKDLRSSKGGRLKLGYGPGGPPVLDKAKFLKLLTQLVAKGYLTKVEGLRAVNKGAR
jgi:hypothetical protein